jgi:hypothetical protein
MGTESLVVEANAIPGFLIQRVFFSENGLIGTVATEGATGEQVELWMLLDAAWRGAPDTVLQSKVKSILAVKHSNLLTPKFALRLRGLTAFIFPKFEGSTLEALLTRVPVLSSKAATQIGMDAAAAITHLNACKVIRAELSLSSILVGATPPAVLRYTGLIDMVRPPADFSHFRPHVNLVELGAILYRCVTGQTPEAATYVDPMVLNNRVWPDLSKVIKDLLQAEVQPMTAADAARDLQIVFQNNTTQIQAKSTTTKIFKRA